MIIIPNNTAANKIIEALTQTSVISQVFKDHLITWLLTAIDTAYKAGKADQK